MLAKILLAFVVLVAAIVLVSSAGPTAPLSHGSYLTYEVGGTRVRVTFREASGGKYDVVVEYQDPGGPWAVGEEMPGHGESVDRRVRGSSGSPLEVASFGPIWASPDDLVMGGRAHGAAVEDVRSENGRDVAVVSAPAGAAGALRGRWRFDVETGFLLSGSLSTAVAESQSFRLVESNITGLGR